jgi:S-DNA-T family DNA segregation ATPase FtsK/SpoIIIE
MASEVRKSVNNFSYTNEIVSISLLAVAVIIFLCLVTYSPNDWSLNTSTSQKTNNLIGTFGSIIADIFLQSIGLTSYFVPVILALLAWQIFRSDFINKPITRLIGFIIFIFSFAALLDVLGISNFFDGQVKFGGIIGQGISNIFVPWLKHIGSFILFFTTSVIGFLLFTNWSLRYVFEQSRFGFGFLFAGISGAFVSLREWETSENNQAKIRAEKRNKQREIDEKEEVTISTGDKPQPKKIEEKQSDEPKTWRDKLSNLVERLSEPPDETVDEDDDEILDAEEIVETPKPKIIVGEDIEIANDDDDEGIVSPPKPIVSLPKPIVKIKDELVDKKEVTIHENPFTIDGSIPITPIQQTGELDEEIIEKLEEKPIEKPVETPKPKQNFETYQLPSSEFLVEAPPRIEQKDEELLAIAQELTNKCKEFNVTGRVMHICQGPVVTTYEFKPDAGVKYSRITNLSDDLCLALKAESIRIERIPGKAYVGIEVPNHNRETIHLREVVESKKFKESNSLLTIALGKTIDGLNYITDLAKTPHLLIAGQTGAGKSVGVNSLIVSILYKAKPDEVKFIMVDPKRLELGLYADIPHLATPIITDPKRAAISLKWAVSEMERRYKDLAGWGVRNIDGYNSEIKRKNELGEFDENGEPWKKLPYIVIIIDELADLMMVAGKEVEESITRLAQMARAVGIHLVLATQRPSVDVITGLIKANFPSRLSFRVSSKIDSRTIIDANGAEKLLGRGDSLYLPPATSQIVRVHGGYVDEKEIAQIVDFIKNQGNPEYDVSITKTEEEIEGAEGLPGRKDPLFWDALKSVVASKRASTSLLQRHLRIGYGRAAAILDAMVREGYIGDMDGSSRARPVLEAAYEALEALESGGEI